MLWELLRTHPRDRLAISVLFLEAGPFEREVAALGVPTAVVNSGRLRSPVGLVRTIVALARAIRRRRPRVLLNWMAKTQLYGAPAAVLSGVHPAIVWWQHLIPEGHWMDRVATALPTTAVGASSEASASAQRRQRPVRRTFCVHPGIDVPAVSSPALSRADLGLREDAVVVVVVGRLQPWKGQDRALRAVALLRAESLDVQLLIVGGAAFGFDVDYGAGLRTLADELGLSAHVTFTGQVPSAHPYLSISDIALNASESEPFGIVVLEAMASGVAVVAVNAAGPAEILRHGEDGLLVPDGSPESLAGALGRLARDGALRSKLANAGQIAYSERRTSIEMSRRIADALEKVAA